MNYIWGGIMLVAIVYSIINGRVADVSNAIISGAGDAVTLSITLLGSMCLWCGIMNIAEKSGLTARLTRMLNPILKILFPGMKQSKDSKAKQAISMNMIANLLGLGNAATPMGLKAMSHLQEENPNKDVASNDMVMFVVLNTASLQLIPTTVAVVRAKHGAEEPMDIIFCCWIATMAALLAGLTATKIFNNCSDLSRTYFRNKKSATRAKKQKSCPR